MKMPMGDRDELNALLDEVLDDDTLTTMPERARAVLAMLRDARQAHRPWVAAFLDDVLVRGIASALRARRDSRSTILVATTKGRVRTRKANRGVRVDGPDGSIVWQQRLIHEMTWEEVEQIAADLGRQIQNLSDSRQMMRRIAELRATYPTAATPSAACEAAGTTLDAYLGMKVA